MCQRCLRVDDEVMEQSNRMNREGLTVHDNGRQHKAPELGLESRGVDAGANEGIEEE